MSGNEGGWTAHVRPRDVFTWVAVTLLLGLAGLVWVTRGDSGEASTVLSLILGGVGTLVGHYQGHKGVEEAQAQVQAVQEELRRTREELAEVRKELAATLPMLKEDVVARKRRKS